MPYLSVHFRESLSPEGEQVHFGLSKDGYHWEAVNGGRPVLRSTRGTCGCRDIEIVRKRSGVSASFSSDGRISAVFGHRRSFMTRRRTSI